jgi:hypothetical protein
MKKHFRRLIAVGLGLGISLTGASTAFAAALNYSVDTTVTVNNVDYTVLAGSAATTLTIGNNTLTVDVPGASTFTLRSIDRFRLSNDQGLTQTCTGTENDVVVPGAATVIFTLSPFPCSSGGSGSSGGGGGGGGDTTTPAPGLIAPAGAVHPPGAVVKTSDGTVWFITNAGQRRAFTSSGAFLSYGFLSFAQVVDATSADLALPTGVFIAPRDGSVFCATETKDSDVKGECALITGGMKAAFTSAAVFNGQGFSFSNAQYGDSSFLAKTTNIASATEAHRPGVLVNNKSTVQLVGQSTLLGIPSMAVFDSWGYNDNLVVPANAADKLLSQSGVMASRIAGQLNP